ncbi:MAG: hypothetical protein GY742_20150 [Hyphomicrobiales bacterium]|nr:hypothetical protein [Hyphomicrobiales bacterium]
MTQDEDRNLSGKLPFEVKLMADTIECRSCKWFWEKPPYGPYPAFDFDKQFPNGHCATGNDSFAARCAGQGIVLPQVLHGCRKAPIMTIGINPNLTGFWPGANGARWAYPLFDDLAKIGFYYRYRTIHQESFPLELIKENLRKESGLVAVGEGRLIGMRRSMVNRTMTVSVEYSDSALGVVDHEIDWDLDNHFVLLFDGKDRDTPFEAQFSKDEQIAGYINLPSNQAAQIERNVVGYYDRFVPVLEKLSGHMRAQGRDLDLRMAEDVCQLDMVACASPGWSDVYEIDKEEVVGQCVKSHGWAIKQLVQNQPQVIVFSGRSAYAMFDELLGHAIEPKLKSANETYGLLGETCRRPYYLILKVEHPDGDFELRSRVIVSPHFSYDDNFMPQARFGPAGWERFEEEFGEAVSELRRDERIAPPNRDDFIAVDIRGLGAFGRKYPKTVKELIRNMYDATDMITQALVQETILGNLGAASNTPHLARSRAGCRFCDNSAWSFPDGCQHGKLEEPPAAPEYLEEISQSILAGLSS